MDKSLQVSDWTKPTKEQLKYAAIDAAVSLEVYEKLMEMPDLTRRLTLEDIHPGKTVDLVPRNGSNVASMATRAATVTVADMLPCQCPRGIKPKNSRGQKMVRAGEGSCVVKIESIYSPGFIIPGFVKEEDGSPVALSDIGLQTVVVPIAMLREHDPSKKIRATPSTDTEVSAGGISKPAATHELPKRSPTDRYKRPMADDFDYSSGRSKQSLDKEIIELVDDEWDDELSFSDGQVGELVGLNDNEIENTNTELTSEDISMLHAAIFQSDEAVDGRTPLQCKGLSDAPKPEDILDKYSVVLGDIFHAMNRTKVPVKHEAKKAFFHALMNAFLVWNEKKKKQLEDKMKEDGMTKEEIEAKRYFNSHLYQSCVERYAPSPKILYWRVRAVYALFGNMVDSSTGKPLFNDAAWKKADNVLKEIRCGFYSDPPGFSMYTKRLRPNGTVMKNKYGMEMIECMRGTNRTEAYHKNLLTTFGSWHTGVEMSDYLLAERRHRHNQQVSEKRRYGFPRIGHYDTWKIDQLQILYLENHGVQLYPYWTNASDYRSTEESFDTVALHHSSLQEAMEIRYQSLGQVKLTNDQQYLCKKMGTRYPFLPFCGKDENKQYAKYELLKTGPVEDYQAGVDWCEFIDGKNIHAKLPSHMRAQSTNANRSQRVKECVRKAKSGIEMINELNCKLSPVSLDQMQSSGQSINGDCLDTSSLLEVESLPDSPNAERNDTEQSSQVRDVAVETPTNTSLEQTTITEPRKPQEQGEPSQDRELTQPRNKQTQQPTQSVLKRKASKRKVPSHSWREAQLPPVMPRLQPQALHAKTTTIVGDFCIGIAPPPKPKIKRAKHCKRCSMFRGEHASSCSGRGGVKLCVHFEEDGTAKPPKPPVVKGPRNCRRCRYHNGQYSSICPGRAGEHKCSYYDIPSEKRPVKRPRNCRRCRSHNGQYSNICSGRAGENKCSYFDADGNESQVGLLLND